MVQTIPIHSNLYVAAKPYKFTKLFQAIQFLQS